MKNKYKLILASGSPRRINMMKEHGLDPIVFPADIEENPPLKKGMNETVMFLALKKALNVEKSWLKNNPESENHIIIAADTIVYHDGEIMGKPADFEDGKRMLLKLKNTFHYVVTGVALVEAGVNHKKVFVEATKVFFKDYTEAELEEYLRTDEAYDKAGAYAIQGYFSKYVSRIEGDYNTVVGFPWDRIQKELNNFIGGKNI